MAARDERIVGITPDDKLLITRGDDGLKAWDLSTGKERVLSKLTGQALALSSDAKVVALAEDRSVRLWDILADQEVASLRRLGYVVEQCSGPTANTCPVLNGGRCALAERSDVLVYDAWASGDADGSTELIADLRRVHPDVPIVLTFPGIGLEGFDDEPAHGVVPLVGQPTGARLHEAIQVALAQVLAPA